MTSTKQTRIHVNYEVIPGFSALKMKQELQEIVYRETEGMTREEIREYFRKGSEEFWKEEEERSAAKENAT